MAQLEPGRYTINFVDFTGGPDNVKTRPLGVQNGTVVILPEDAPAPQWFFDAAGAPLSFQLSVDGVFVAPEGDRVVASPGGAEPHAWFVLRSAPHPPPVGSDAFALFASAEPGASAWNPDDGEGSTPITLKPIGYPFWVKRAEN